MTKCGKQQHTLDDMATRVLNVPNNQRTVRQSPVLVALCRCTYQTIGWHYAIEHAGQTNNNWVVNSVKILGEHTPRDDLSNNQR